MSKMNCWKIKKCGREPGGSMSEELGVCPAASDASCVSTLIVLLTSLSE